MFCIGDDYVNGCLIRFRRPEYGIYYAYCGLHEQPTGVNNRV